MATKLGLYNRALRVLGETKLSSLSEAREPRYILDDIYDDSLIECLEFGFWKFAIRTIEITYDPDTDPNFGYTYAFNKPIDWVRTFDVSSDENFSVPLTRVLEEANVWLADSSPIYVKYVSSDSDYGLDLSKWPAQFTMAVAHYLAMQAAPSLTQSNPRIDYITKQFGYWKSQSLSNDAMNGAVGTLPVGSWLSARSTNSNKSRAAPD